MELFYHQNTYIPSIFHPIFIIHSIDIDKFSIESEKCIFQLTKKRNFIIWNKIYIIKKKLERPIVCVCVRIITGLFLKI